MTETDYDMKRKRNYSRFYALCKAAGVDLGQFKEDLVSQFTDGRTVSLREMSDSEYEEMCDCLQSGRRRTETRADYLERRRKMRSAVLNRMQRLGVDTTDFDRVNAFCQSPRIAGKPFGMLTPEELERLVPKLEAMLRKPGPRAAGTPVMAVPVVVYGKPSRLPN